MLSSKDKKLALFIIISCCIIGLIISGLFLYKAFANNPKKIEQNTISPTITPSDLPIVVSPTVDNSDSSSSPIDLSVNEYKEVKSELTNLIQTQNPKVALERLAKLMDENKKILRSCHGLAHEIGHLGFDKYKGFREALEYNDEVCGSGYMHGVIEQHFANVSDVKAEMKVVCPNADGRCYHAVGHGLMYYTNGEIPEALNLCNSYAEKSARIYCSEGVYMENFEANELAHQPKYLRPSEPFYPCPEQKDVGYKSVCYFYSGRYLVRLYKDNYFDALKHCESAEMGYGSACAKGVGSIAMRHNIKSGKTIEEICTKAKANLISFCIDGAVGYHAVNFRSRDKTREMCTEFVNNTYKQNCMDAILTRF